MLPMMATHAIGSAQANENSFKPDLKTDRSYFNAKQQPMAILYIGYI